MYHELKKRYWGRCFFGRKAIV